MTSQPELPKVAVIGTGGTISSISGDPLDVLDYPDFSKKGSVGEIVARTPEIARFANCLPVGFREVGSTAIGPSDWLALVRLIHEIDAAHPDLAGFVILHGTARLSPFSLSKTLLHGTATLEETAYFLSLALKTRRPVALVGAQRPASAVSADGPMNLVAAVRTIVDPAAREVGVVVVLNDEIQAAREVTKISSYRLNTFRTPDYGVLGQVDGDRVALYRRSLRPHTTETIFDVSGMDALPRVDIAYSYAGADGVAVDAMVAAGARGMISAGLPPGIPPPLQRQALERAARAGVVIVQTSRGGAGRIARRRYLREQGMVAGDNLNAQKARVLLMLALTQTSDPESVQRLFDTY